MLRTCFAGLLLTLIVATSSAVAQPGYNPGEPANGTAPAPSPDPGEAYRGNTNPATAQPAAQPVNFGSQSVLPAPTGRPRVPVPQWFVMYNQVRHRAQLSPGDRQRADQIMSKGLNMFMPGDDKQAAKTLLTSMVARYQTAVQEMKQLPVLPQTQKLHAGYLQYFTTAGNLFADYLRVQDNLFLTDPMTGQPVAAGLITRKQNLEGLERACKEYDAQLRHDFGVPPYPF